MRPARNATPGPSTTTSHVPLRNRNINKRQLSDTEDGGVKRVKRPARGRDEGEGREKKRRRRRKRRVSVVSAASENVLFAPALPGHRQTMREKRRFRRDESDDEDTLDSVSKAASSANSNRDSKASHATKEEKQSEQSDSRVKSAASPVDCPADTIARLTEQLEAQNQLVKKHEELLAQVQQSVSCQICLDLMWKPYALAPCGHIACYDCLVAWFTTEPADGDPAPHVHLRKKTCPHCRAIVREAPVEVWNVKSIVTGIARSSIVSGLAPAATTDSDDNGGGSTPKDPWSHIFKPIPPIPGNGDELGFYDAEDGGIYRCLYCMHEIWDGICSFCGRVYPEHQGDEADDVVGPEDGLDYLLEDVWGPEITDREREMLMEEERGYESSFIDDDDDDDDVLGWSTTGIIPHYVTTDEERDHPWSTGRIVELDSDSDEISHHSAEEDTDRGENSPRRSNRASRRLVVSDDEESHDHEIDELAESRSAGHDRDSSPFDNRRVVRPGRALAFDSDRNSSVEPPRIRLTNGRRIETDDESDDSAHDEQDGRDDSPISDDDDSDEPDETPIMHDSGDDEEEDSYRPRRRSARLRSLPRGSDASVDRN